MQKHVVLIWHLCLWFVLWAICAPIVRQCSKKTLLLVACTCTLLHNRSLIFRAFYFCSVWLKAAKTGSGRRGRKFESCHSDQNTATKKAPSHPSGWLFAFWGHNGRGIEVW